MTDTKCFKFSGETANGCYYEYLLTIRAEILEHLYPMFHLAFLANESVMLSILASHQIKTKALFKPIKI